MDTITARPGLLKQANLSLIRKIIRERRTATRAEIADETKISSTTVRSLLSEMLENGEIESIGCDPSGGGRKAERYRLRPDRYYCAAVCMSGERTCGILSNVCGEILETTWLQATEGNFEPAILTYLDELTEKHELKSIGVGVPGVVEGGGYWRQNLQYEFKKDEIGKLLADRYHLPVIMENDLNATAIGFERCYEHEFPAENPENTHMVYLHFEDNCISAGIIAGGRVIRGSRHYAGELSLIPMEDGRSLSEWITAAADDISYIRLVTRIIGWVCGILNPQYVVLGGPNLRKDCIAPISDGLSAALPDHAAAEILYSEDIWRDYQEGMAYLAAGKMFDDIQFVKEQT